MNVPEKRKFYISLAQRRVQPGSGSSLSLLSSKTAMYPIPNIQALITQTPFVIVGGVATRLYMPERMTLDIDILICVHDAHKLYRELRHAGCQLVHSLTIGGTHWQLPDGALLDVIESNEPWAQAALQHPQYNTQGQPVIALPYLIVMKLQSGRVQDIADITRMLGGAREETLQDVRSVVRTYISDAEEDIEQLIMLGKLEWGG